MIRKQVSLVLGLALALVLASCGSNNKDTEGKSSGKAGEQVVNVIAKGLTFEAPGKIPSGWTTFRFSNKSTMVHFALIEKLPEGQGIESQQREVAPVFQKGMDLLSAGDTDAAMAEFGKLPAWFGQIVYLGGPGLTSPGHVSEATVKLEPGTYLLECYVKTNGVFHSYNPDSTSYGMVHEFTVTADSSQQQEPTAQIAVEISSKTGFTMSGTPAAGRQTFSVTFVDQIAHENFVGHDVHVARLPEDADIDKLEQWMDWRQPGGLQTPSPVEFVGGLNEMPSGSRGYFTVNLKPGRYALVSEVPGIQAKGLLRTFTVE